MTREEQIRQESHTWGEEYEDAFIDGARWADRHPYIPDNLTDRQKETVEHVRVMNAYIQGEKIIHFVGSSYIMPYTLDKNPEWRWDIFKYEILDEVISRLLKDNNCSADLIARLTSLQYD